MRKFLTMLAVAVAAFSLASCNKEIAEETMPSPEGMQLNITVGELQTTDAETKAVKKGWAKGDKINIWYDANSELPDLVIAYDGSEWSVDVRARVSGKSPASSGKLVGVYVESGLSGLSYSSASGSSKFIAPRFVKVVDGMNRPSAMPLTSYAQNVDYSFASNILTADLSKWLFKGANVQVVISGLPEEDWFLKCDRFNSPTDFSLSGSASDKITISNTSTTDTYAGPVGNADGTAYVFSYSGNDSDFTFTLFNASTSDRVTYTAKGKSLDNSGNKLNAIKIPFSKFMAIAGTAKRAGSIDVKWVQLWKNGPKFAEYNVGAANNKAEDYGGYYCWGGSIDKDPVAAYKNGTDVLSGTDDTATNLWGSAWRMPTQAELQALLDNCDVEWTTVRGVIGRKFTGKGDFSSNSMFLPAAGYCMNGDVNDQSYDGYYGDYWSSTPDDSKYAYELYFRSDNQYVYYSRSRYYGYSVRAVLAE